MVIQRMTNDLKSLFHLLALFISAVALTACAYGHLGAIDERNGLWGPSVPKDFASTVPNNIGTWKFYSFGRMSPTSDVYTAQFYDTGNVKRSGDEVRISTYTYTNRSDVAPNGKAYSAIIRQVYMNCAKHTYSNVASTYYPTQKPDGKVVYKDNFNKTFKPESVPDYDTIDKVFRMVCKS